MRDKIIGTELAISVANNFELFFENYPKSVSFNKGDKIGVRIRSAEGGGEEVCCFLTGYCTN